MSWRVLLKRKWWRLSRRRRVLETRTRKRLQAKHLVRLLHLLQINKMSYCFQTFIFSETISLFLLKLHSWWTNLLVLPRGSRRRRKPRRYQPDKTPPEDFWRSWRGWAAGWRRRNSVAAPHSSSCSCTTSWGTWWGRWWPNCTRASVSQTPNPKNASH